MSLNALQLHRTMSPLLQYQKKIHTNQQSLKVKFLPLFTHVESVSFKSSKYEKQRKTFLMALQETNKNASLKCLEKGTVWLLSPND